MMGVHLQPDRRSGLCPGPHWILLFVTLLAGCGDETTAADALDVRSLLGLSADHFAAMSAAEKDRAARLLLEHEDSEESHLIETGSEQSERLPSPLFLARQLDQSRQAYDLSPVLVASLFEAENRLDGGQVSLTRYFERCDEAPLCVVEADDVQQSMPPERVIVDDRWYRNERRALAHHSERAMVSDLAPLWWRISRNLGASADRIQVVPARRSPVLIYYAHEHQALLVHPILLYLIAGDDAAVSTSTSDRHQASSLRDARAASAQTDGAVSSLPRVSDGQTYNADGGGSSDCGADIEQGCADGVEQFMLFIAILGLSIAAIFGLLIIAIFV